ncbi:MAG: hypothetical protein JWO30_629 [Fibrobacteres bacterium]|nr:hypothetical protein [Fibrobacterota bacterium]
MPEDDVGGSVGIYELGMHMQNKVWYFENGLQAEAGIHNGSPAFSVGFDFLPYVPIFQSNIVLAAGWGITLNSYSKEKFDISGQKYFRRVNDYAGVVKLQLEILKRLIGALEFMDDTEIFWKARLGYILIEI